MAYSFHGASAPQTHTGARFSKVPKTYRAEKPFVKLPIRSFKMFSRKQKEK